MWRQVLRKRAVWLAIPWSALGLVGALLLALGRTGVAYATDWVVGGVCGITIQACINYGPVVAGDKILIPAGTYTESLTLAESVSLSGLPGLAAQTIVRPAAGRALRVTGAVSQSITLQELTFTRGSAAGNGGGVLVESPAAIVLQSLIISNNVATTSGGGLYVSNTVVMADVTFISNTATSNGGAAWALNAAVTDGLFVRNRCTGFCSGGGIFAQAALTLTDTTFQTNTSAYNGGGAGAVTHAIVTGGLFENNTSNTNGYGGGGLVAFGTSAISGTQFISNSAYTYGGGLFAWLTSTLTNTDFLNNSATFTNGRGGGAYVDLGTATITGGLFQGNHSAQFGGGLFTRLLANVIDTAFSSNTSVSNGGGAWTHQAAVGNALFQDNECTGNCSGAGLWTETDLALADTTFTGNTSVGNGGGAWALNATVTGGTFERNRCTGFCSGGGILAQSGLTLTDTIIENNSSAGNGGGASASGHASVTGGLFQNNTSNAAGSGGGGLISFGTSAISGTYFISNSAYTYGGGLLSWFTSTLTNTVFLSNSATLTNALGGGAVVDQGAATITGGLFGGNRSGGAGGGLFTSLLAAIRDTVFSGNTSVIGGGGAWTKQANVNGALFEDNECTGSCFGGGIYAQTALTLTDTDILSSRSTGNGGGAWALNATVTNGLFENNHCTGFCSGGGIYAQAALSLTHTTIQSNTSAYNGGGAGAATRALVMGGLFRNNTSSTAGYGGGGLVSFGTTAISGTQFISNSAYSYGGGLYSWLSSTLTHTTFISNLTVLNNGTGGAAYLWQGTARVAGGHFGANQAGFGGGVYIGGIGILEGALFTDNRAVVGAGGGLRVLSHTTLINVDFIGNQSLSFCGGGAVTLDDESTTTVQGGLFSQNTAGSVGGGLCSFGPATVSGSRFLANQAERGGGIYLADGDSQVVNTLLAGNTATTGLGNALFTASSDRVEILHTTIASPTQALGSGLYISATGQVGITNTIIASHTIGIQVDGGSVYEDYNLIYGTLTPTVGSTGGAHNVAGLPIFTAPLSGDYHLGPASAAIDRGAFGTGVGTDFDGEPRPFGPRPDMGYDERSADYRLHLPVALRVDG